MRLVTPVEVSLWTTITALMSRALSSASFASIAAGSTPWRQSPGMKSTSRPHRSRHLPPQRGEMAGLDHQHLVARRQRVDDRRLPGAGSRRRIDDDRTGRLEERLAALEHVMPEALEFRPAMVDDLPADRPQHAVRNRARSGNLQEMVSLALSHAASLTAEMDRRGTACNEQLHSFWAAAIRVTRPRQALGQHAGAPSHR